MDSLTFFYLFVCIHHLLVVIFFSFSSRLGHHRTSYLLLYFYLTNFMITSRLLSRHDPHPCSCSPHSLISLLNPCSHVVMSSTNNMYFKLCQSVVISSCLITIIITFLINSGLFVCHALQSHPLQYQPLHSSSF